VPDRFASIVLLVEDENQAALIRRHLERRGHHRRQITVAEAREGDGVRHVLSRYAAEVAEARRRCAPHKPTALLVCLDADHHTVQSRHEELDGQLTDVRGHQERILHLIPRRTIETWLLCLDGRVVDEETRYALPRRKEVQYGRERLAVAKLTRPAAEALFTWSRPNVDVPAHCIPSLRAALVDELPRLQDGY
jgi:hypothetical protein